VSIWLFPDHCTTYRRKRPLSAPVRIAPADRELQRKTGQYFPGRTTLSAYRVIIDQMIRLRALALIAGLSLAGQEQPKIFRITPVRPVAELRTEALTLKPPAESGDFRPPDLVDVAKLDPRIKLEIRYATTDNFLSTPVYSSARAFLQRPAAEALLAAQRDLVQQGYGLLIFDAYRPWYVTKMFWDATPPDKHQFVADPSQGSRHNRGCAVDLSIYDLATGREIPMTGVYDEMSERSYPTYSGGTPEQRAHRDLLRAAMEKQGFAVYETEWWHFDYRDWPHYAIQNIPFEQIR